MKAKLTDKDREEIRRLYYQHKEGKRVFTMKELGEEYGVSKQTICDVLRPVRPKKLTDKRRCFDCLVVKPINEFVNDKSKGGKGYLCIKCSRDRNVINQTNKVLKACGVDNVYEEIERMNEIIGLKLYAISHYNDKKMKEKWQEVEES